jgi:hypothetical protein
VDTPWYIQLAEASLVALTLVALSAGVVNPNEWLGSAAVLVSFLHLQVQEEARVYAPSRTSVKFFGLLLIREALWVAYFYFAGTYAAIVGAVFFAAFPFWRQLYYRRCRRKKRERERLDDRV